MLITLTYEMLGVSEKIFSNPVYSVLSPSLLYIYLYCPINIPNEYVVHKTYCSYTYESITEPNYIDCK